MNRKIIIALLGVMLVFSCKKSSNENANNAGPTPYKIAIPQGFPAPQASLNNPLTVEGIALGKRLYADPILSTNGRSCTSCHQPTFSFSSPMFNAANGYKISVLPHINLAFKTFYNWNGSVVDLDTLAMDDFEKEFFDTNPELLYQKLSSHPDYPRLFKQAFGIDNIYSLSYHELKVKICYALAQYMRTKISVNAKYDRYKAGKENLDALEYLGSTIFFSERGDCFHCHSYPMFTDNDFHNNGLASEFNGFDQGRFLVSNHSNDMGRFMTPTLRNIEFTAPYMHDGRFKTLEEVVNFYDAGVQNSATIDPILNKRKNLRSLGLSNTEKIALIAFLKTLSDHEYVN